jgi:hypothetical protein
VYFVVESCDVVIDSAWNENYIDSVRFYIGSVWNKNYIDSVWNENYKLNKILVSGLELKIIV